MSVSNNETLKEQCTLLLDAKTNIPIGERLSSFFDNVGKEFQKNSTLKKNDDAIANVVTTLLAVDKKQWHKRSQLSDHSLLVILRDYLVDFFLVEKCVDWIQKISSLFYDIYYSVSITDAMVNLILYKPLIDKINIVISSIENYQNSIKLIESMDLLIRIVQRIQMIRIDVQVQQNTVLETLFQHISNFVASTFFISQMMNSTETMAELGTLQRFLFDTCIEFMYWQPYEEILVRKETLKKLCEIQLASTAQTMESSRASEPLMRFICLLCLSIMVEDDFTDENLLYPHYVNILRNFEPMLTQIQSETKTKLILDSICHLTYLSDLLMIMKEMVSLKSSLLQLSETENYEVSFNAYRILALVMSEDDVKTLKNANKIVSIFNLYFASMLDDPIQKSAFQSLLHSLTSLVQHDQVKTEILEQNMIPLLIRCVTNKQKFHSTKIQQYAIEILFALSFNKNAATILEKDSGLMKCLKTLKSSTEESIQRAANHLIWQLEQTHKKRAVNLPQTDSKLQFDIMLSYSHGDKKLCFEICNFLEANGFKVWIDRDQMHGDAMVAMAHAIENSEFVMICMSETYKLSPYCQAEANYAFQRQCKIIPLVMKPKYKPDGWLGFITSGKIYIDFTKYEFSTASTMLKTEIEKKRAILERPRSPPLTHQISASSLSSVHVDQVQTSLELPHDVNKWSEDHVRLFLSANHLTPLSIVFADFNGNLLYQTYLMCEKNRESMFQAMRMEVNANSDGSSILTLGIYLRFLEALKKYIPIQQNSSTQIATSSLCMIM